MKLLLTSAGINNPTIAKVLKKWVKDIRIAFIPTAANMEEGDKSWLIDDYNDCRKLGTIDIVDIASVDKKMWLPRLEQANVIVIGGGNTEYLMKQIISSGLKNELPRLLKERVYVGISAGSIVMSKTLNASSEFLYGDEPNSAVSGLKYINFNIRPHLNSKYFPKVRDSILKKVVKKLDGDTYALDNSSAVVVDTNNTNSAKISVISEGKWILYKKN
jgi:dipeptidase E